MFRSSWSGVCSVVLCAAALPAAAQPRVTLEQYLSLARLRSPAVLAARTSSAEARGQRAGATPLSAHNPSVSGMGGGIMSVEGPRLADVDWGGAGSIQLNVPVEVAGQRGARIRAADARITAQDAQVAVAELEASAGAAEAFVRTQHALALARLAEEARVVAEEQERAVRAREAAGVVTGVEADLAMLEVLEARRLAEASRLAADRMTRELAARVGLTAEELGVPDGALPAMDALPALDDAMARAERRPEILALGRGKRAALEEAHVARANAIPTPQFNGMYQYWRREHALVAGVTVPLPVFARGQGEEARARARAAGMEDEAHAARQRARANARAAHAHLNAVRAARLALAEGDRVDPREFSRRLHAQFREHKVDLATALAAQRRAMAAARATLDLDLEEALATLWLKSAMGVP